MSALPSPDTATLETLHSLDRDGVPIPARYLLEFGERTARIHTLPDAGTVVCGRSRLCAVRIEDARASREHAKLTLTRDAVHVEDMGTNNGTFVNDVRIAGAVRLVSGDVVLIAGTRFIVRTADPSPDLRAVALDPLRALVDDEVARAKLGRRSAAVLAVASRRLGEVAPHVARELSRFDRVAEAPGHLLALLPEATRARAEEVAARVSAALGAVDPEARVGFAIYPDDAADARALEAAAKRAVAANDDAAPEAQRFGDHDAIVVEPSMAALFALLGRVASSELPVLLHGETGTGKEVAARSVHERSVRRRHPFLAVNCAAIPDPLVEAEFFGFTRGAFTGATAAKRGYFAAADKGTLFLDEIAELSAAAQAKLLRALETRRYVQVGDTEEQRFDVRLVAATHRDLRREIAEGRFREDLYYRVAGAIVWLPPLRERPSELPVLARRFLDDARARMGLAPLVVEPAAMQRLFSHAWPGNIRELKNACEFFAVAAPGDVLGADVVDARLSDPSAHAREHAIAQAGKFRRIDDEIEELERRRMQEALAATGNNQTRAAEQIGMPLRTFVKKVARYGLGR